MKIDYQTYTEKFYNKKELAEVLKRKTEVIKKFNNSAMIGWTRLVSADLINSIMMTSSKIKASSSCLVVIGIGGSFMGSKAVQSIFTDYFNDKGFKVIYAGVTMSAKYLHELTDYLKDIDFTIDVISKSGTTRETILTYHLLKELLATKYTQEECSRRIIITTGENTPLYDEALTNNYQLFLIPKDIGGRYSLITAAHLLPLSLRIDIKKFCTGYYEGLKEFDAAYNYAAIRKLLFTKKKYVENFVVYEDNMLILTEWLKQLFGETEGKDNKGIYPTGILNTRDLHSLGQFIQEGNHIIFETVIKINETRDSISKLNALTTDAVIKAHYNGNVAQIVIEIAKETPENIAHLMAFFMLSAAFSGFLFDINPFNQPGVEVYKNQVRQELEKVC